MRGFPLGPAASPILISVVLGASFPVPCAERGPAPFRGPIDAALTEPRPLVLIVPTNETDAEAQGRIRAITEEYSTFLKGKLPGRRVSILEDREASRRDLSRDTLLVFGTPRGNLWLADRLADLPFAVEPARVIADREYRGDDLSLISAWRHPQDPSAGIIIYTAQRAREVLDLYSRSYGETDYILFRGKTVLRSGNYASKRGRWSCGFPLPDALEDLDFLFDTIERVHPYPLAHISASDLEGVKARSRAALRRAGERDGHVTQSVLGQVIAEAAASFGDGHTSADLVVELDARDPSHCMPPFRFAWRAGRVVIGKTAGGLERLSGAEVTGIDGKPLAEFMAPILAKASGERDAFRWRRFLSAQERYWGVSRPVKAERMALQVRRAEGGADEVTVALIPLDRYRRDLQADPRPPAGLEFHDDGRTCCWRYYGFDASPAGKLAIEAVFRDLRDRGSRSLIIDLRANGGGGSVAGEWILDHLTTRPFCIYSRAFRGRLSRWPPDVPDGPCPPYRLRAPRKVESPFRGSVYLIVGPGTFSAASDFAHALKDLRIGTVVGEETGGVRRALGDTPGFETPNGGIPFWVSTKLFYPPVSRPDDDRRGTVPDIAIDGEKLEPFRGAADPELAFTLDLAWKDRVD